MLFLLYNNYFQLYNIFLNRDNDDINSKPKKYYECILQNGFYIFFLISYYLESDNTLDDPVVKLFKIHKKNKMLGDDANSKLKWITNSILG